MNLGRISISLIVIAGLFATPSIAQNLLTNPNFDGNVTGWLNGSLNVLQWISNDGDPSGSGPGCLEISDNLNNNAHNGAIQINITVTPDTTYLLSGSARIPTGSVAVSARIWVQWYDAGLNLIGFSTFLTVTSIEGGPWTTASEIIVSPPNAVEAWVRPGFLMPGSGTEEALARWDDLFFGLAADEIFADGFESGSFGAWTGVLP